MAVKMAWEIISSGHGHPQGQGGKWAFPFAPLEIGTKN